MKKNKTSRITLIGAVAALAVVILAVVLASVLEKCSRDDEVEKKNREATEKQEAIKAAFDAIEDVTISDSPAVGDYLCEKTGVVGAFSLSLNSDLTFTYCEGLASSHIGLGKWEDKDGRITLFEQSDPYDTGAIIRTFVFNYEDGCLVFDKAASSRFIYVDLDDGTKFLSMENIDEDFLKGINDPILSGGN